MSNKGTFKMTFYHLYGEANFISVEQTVSVVQTYMVSARYKIIFFLPAERTPARLFVNNFEENKLKNGRK